MFLSTSRSCEVSQLNIQCLRVLAMARRSSAEPMALLPRKPTLKIRTLPPSLMSNTSRETVGPIGSRVTSITGVRKPFSPHWSTIRSLILRAVSGS